MAEYRVKENISFITQIRDHPALWDQTHHLHSDKLVCEALWEYIGNKFNINGPSAKSRWKNLRDNFRRELRRSEIGLHGTSAEEYKSSWRYFNSMFFVKDQLRQNNIISPLAMSRTQNRLDAKEDSSSSVLPNGEKDEVEIVETTHDAFVKEFPKPSYSKSAVKQDGGGDLQKHMAAAMLASIDPDVGFLASLLPHLRSVNSEKKALLKNHLLQVILQYSDNEEIDKATDCDEFIPCSGSEEAEASNKNCNESVSVNTNKRKLTFVQDSGAKKTTVEGSVIIEV